MRNVIDILTWEPNVKMQYELLLMLLLFLMAALHAKKRSGLLKSWGLLFCLFAFLHRALLPLLVSGVYAYVLLGLCNMLFRLRPCAFLEPAVRLWNLLKPGRGTAGRSTMEQRTSAPANQDQKDRNRRGQADQDHTGRDRKPSDQTDPDKIRSRGVYFLLAIILVALLLQLCRINIAIDYDSLRYGLRSPYVLLGGEGLSGFFKNPGLVNTVYTYSKGFELLTLPLALFGELPVVESYAYVLCFNFWVLLGILFFSGAITMRLTGSRTAGILAAFFCALIPGITNMALTAKADLLTLLCQLVFVYAVLVFLAGMAAGKDLSVAGKDSAGDAAVSETAAARETAAGEALSSEQDGNRRRFDQSAAVGLSLSSGDWVGIGLAALLASFALKPTSMVFSSVLGLCALSFLLLQKYRGSGIRKKSKKFFLCPSFSSLRPLFLSIFFVGICWFRSFLITGMPVTSVFSGIFSALGFSLRYPFSIQAVPDSAAALSFTDSLRQLFTRLFGVLIFPAGEEMAHVRMAWGGFVFLLLFLLLLVLGQNMRRRLQEAAGQNKVRREGALLETDVRECTVSMFSCLLFLFYGIGAVSLLSLYALYQIDGNYYMLLYALSASGGAAVLFWVRRIPGVTEPGRFFGRWKPGQEGLILLTALMLEVTAFTGWAGAVGFTEIPIQISGTGIQVGSFLPVSHRKTAEERLRKEGSYHLMQALSESPKGKKAHVIAFSAEPECYDIPCVTESYTDIAGSGGNVYLVKKLNIFKEYLSWAGVDYIYGDKAWLSQKGNERAKELLEDLIEDGTLCGIIYEAEAAALLQGQDADAAGTGDGITEEKKEAIAGKAGSRTSQGTDTEETFLAGQRYFYGRIDPKRAAEPWEVPLSSEKAAQAEEDMRTYEAEGK